MIPSGYSARPSLRRLDHLFLRYIIPRKEWFALLLLATMALTVFSAALPVVFASILQLILGNEPASASTGSSVMNLGNIGGALLSWSGLTGGARSQSIAILAFAYLILSLLNEWVGYAAYMIGINLALKAGRDLQVDLARHLLRLPPSYFAKQKAGDLVSRLEWDTMIASTHFQEFVVKLASGLPVLAFYSFLLFMTSWKLAIAVALGAAASYLVVRLVQPHIQLKVVDHAVSAGRLNARLHESLSNIKTVKYFGAEDFETVKLRESMAASTSAHLSFAALKHFEAPVRQSVQNAVSAGVLVLAAFELIQGRLNPAGFFMFIFVARACMDPIGKIATALTQGSVVRAATVRLDQLLAERLPTADGRGQVSKEWTTLCFRACGFRFGSGEAVLHDVDLTLRRGEVLAVVGSSGAGKSTLLDLLCRLQEPTSGSVQLDGVDIRSLDLPAYRALFGVVPQEVLLFHETIHDNIVYNTPGADRHDVIRAAKTANAHAFIEALPQGYDTLVGDRGTRMSGGQRQRVAIARALLRKPEIIVFDEATNSLDGESEKSVQEAVWLAASGRTAVIVAHRLSTIQNADKIAVISDGRIEFCGTLDEAQRSSATFRALFLLASEERR